MAPNSISRRHLLQASGLSFFAGCSAWSKPKKTVDPQNIELDRSSWTHTHHDTANTNHAPQSHSPSTVSLTQQWRIPNVETYATVSDGQSIYTVLRHQSQDVLWRVNTATGTPDWRFRPTIEDARNIRINLPTLSQTTVYVNVEFRTDGKAKSRIYALNRHDGSPQWQTDVTTHAAVRLHESGIAIVAQQDPDISLVEALDATTGEKLWEFPQKESSFPFFGKKKQTGYQEDWIPPLIPIVGNRLYVAVVKEDWAEMHVLNVKTGEVQKQFDIPSRVEHSLVATNGLLYGTTHTSIPGTDVATGVYAFDPREEQLSWATVTTDDVYWIGVSNEIVYFLDYGGMRSVDARTGKELWQKDSVFVYPAILGNHVATSKPKSNRLTFHNQRTGHSVAEISLQKSDEISYVLSDNTGVYITTRIYNKGSTLYKFS
ncbi:outer membrane protein assembly factor BamB family protein [Haladaptatus caseinilyticus]|uniref:outer membrane protein assembly factor BamB family protein n=1 Tax=Haladaptatus caseinilyticus TaxID=2993314 RepID=UPI00224AFC4F|nr:PQQ-binding-like beta-propeller repeat protein [Haladaptatus caseinilyticus]